MKTKLRRALLVIRHAWQMYRNLTLPRNVAKGGWRGLSQQELLRLLMVEYEELYVEVYRADRGTSSARRVAEEAADVSAYAAMLADNARKQNTTKKEPRMKLNNKGFTVIELAITIICGVLTPACVYGWAHNIYIIFNSPFTPFTGQLALRLAGIFLAPLGVIMGYL